MSCAPGEIAEFKSKTGTPAWLAVLTAGTIAVGSDGVSTRALTCFASRSLTSEISVDMSPPPFSRSTFMPSLVGSWVSAAPIPARNGFVVSLIMTPRVYVVFPVPPAAPETAAELDVPELQAARPKPRTAAMPARAGLRSDRDLGLIWIVVDFTVLSLGRNRDSRVHGSGGCGRGRQAGRRYCAAEGPAAVVTEAAGVVPPGAAAAGEREADEWTRLYRSSVTATRMTRPVTVGCQYGETLSWLSPLAITPRSRVAASTSGARPIPPVSAMPATTQMAIASSGQSVAAEGCPMVVWPSSTRPPAAAKSPPTMKANICTRWTGTPDRWLASALPPTL